jgi:hypothetical protein
MCQRCDVHNLKSFFRKGFLSSFPFISNIPPLKREGPMVCGNGKTDVRVTQLECKAKSTHGTSTGCYLPLPTILPSFASLLTLPRRPLGDQPLTWGTRETRKEKPVSLREAY